MIGVYIMSVLRAGLPSMNLQSQYQTFFTGIVVLGAVLLDIYRTKKATEVRILSPSAEYKEKMMQKIAVLKTNMVDASSEQKATLRAEMVSVRSEMRKEYAKMKRIEKEQALAQRKEEKEFEKR